MNLLTSSGAGPQVAQAMSTLTTGYSENMCGHTCGQGTARQLGHRQHFGEAEALGGVLVGKQAVAPVQTVTGVAAQCRHCDYPLRFVRLAASRVHTQSTIHCSLLIAGPIQYTNKKGVSVTVQSLDNKHEPPAVRRSMIVLKAKQ